MTSRPSDPAPDLAADRPPAGAATASATRIGCLAILLWALLAPLTTASGAVPPFQLLTLTFGLASLLGLTSWTVRPGAWRALRQPPLVWLLGVGGLFGYHAVYFAALRAAPPAEASLIAYLWPLLIVLLSGLLPGRRPGDRLAGRHLLGAALGFAGVVVLALGRGGLALETRYLPGYGLALLCAGIWSSYSVLSRRVSAVPTDAVVGFCLVTALIGLPCHLAWEQTRWPEGAVAWACVVALGLGPVGAAFYAWDHGMKQGDIRLLGVASYATPILSTLILVALGFAAPTIWLALACLLIAGGAFLAAR